MEKRLKNQTIDAFIIIHACICCWLENEREDSMNNNMLHNVVTVFNRTFLFCVRLYLLQKCVLRVLLSNIDADRKNIFAPDSAAVEQKFYFQCSKVIKS